MTNNEILEAQKLIADMRDVLSALAGTTDEDKLVDAVATLGPRIDAALDKTAQALKEASN
jgi:hypothetical protein